MKIALFAGTFGPPTRGHLDVIQRSKSLCDKLYVGVAGNPNKPSLFTVEERESMLKKICHSLPHVSVVRIPALTVDFAKQHKVDFLLRGLRSFSDFEAESNMAVANRNLSGIDTVFLIADEKVSHISSSLIRELGKFQCRLHDFIPAEIEEQVFRRLSHSDQSP